MYKTTITRVFQQLQWNPFFEMPIPPLSGKHFAAPWSSIMVSRVFPLWALLTGFQHHVEILSTMLTVATQCYMVQWVTNINNTLRLDRSQPMLARETLSITWITLIRLVRTIVCILYCKILFSVTFYNLLLAIIIRQLRSLSCQSAFLLWFYSTVPWVSIVLVLLKYIEALAWSMSYDCMEWFVIPV